MEVKIRTFSTTDSFTEFVNLYKGNLTLKRNKAYDNGRLVAFKVNTNSKK